MKALKITTIILIAVIITVAAFFGIYKKEEYHVINILKDYKLGMDFLNKRVIKANVSDDEKEKTVYDSEGTIVEIGENDDLTEYTEENGYKILEKEIDSKEYVNTKKYLDKKLKLIGVHEYNVKLNQETGEITVEIPDDDNADKVESYLKTNGTFSLEDAETGEELLNETYITNTGLMYGSDLDDNGDTVSYVYLRINLNKEGQAKLKELKTIYVKDGETVTTEEDGEEKTETKDKEVCIKLCGDEIGDTVITNIIYQDSIALCLGYSAKQEEFKEQSENASNIAKILKIGVSPLEYDFEESEIQETTISNKKICIYIVGVSIVILAACIYLIVKFKLAGILATIVEISYIALLILVVRYTNVVITIEGIGGIILAAVINYELIYSILASKNEPLNTLNKVALTNIPIYIIGFIFAFATSAHLNSFGMTLIWGSIVTYVYNLLLTIPLVQTSKEGKNAKRK